PRHGGPAGPGGNGARRRHPDPSAELGPASLSAMRIFYAAVSTPNLAIESDLWRRNLYEPLVDLGHDVVEFRYDLRPTFVAAMGGAPPAAIARNRAEVSGELLRQIRA